MRHLLCLGLLLALNSVACAAPAWLSEDDRPTQQALEVLREMNEAQRYGLDPDHYRLRLTGIQRAVIDAGRADRVLRDTFEHALTDSVTRFLRHVRTGRVSPDAVGFHLPGQAPFDAAAAARRLASADDVRGTIAALEPPARPYWRLKQALARYRDLAQDRSLTQLPRIARSIRGGEPYAGARALRRLLRATGDLPTSESIEGLHDVVDARTVEALERFQARHGLDPDGILGRKTFAALTTPFASRVRQIELTLERWRWTSALERPDIIVNVPQFMLFALPRRTEPDGRVLEMAVIVGQADPHMRTPVFTADLEYVVFQPYWDVPSSIVRRELLPLIRKDPGYLDRHDLEIVRGSRVVAPTPAAIEQLAAGALRLRQRPGPKNALGQIKFMLPNPHSVYLHATPGVELFDRSSRAFSHGCIRVSKPAELAQYVLKNAAERWDAARIEAALCDSTTRRVDLTTPLRVMIFYGTAVVTDALGVMFVEDIYGHDATLAPLIAAEPAPDGLKTFLH